MTRGRPRINWENKIERIGQQRVKAMAKIKRMRRDWEEWMKYTERGKPDTEQQ